MVLNKEEGIAPKKDLPMSTALMTSTRRGKIINPRKRKFLIQFLLYLSPVILLTTIFPLVTPQISEVTLGGVALTQVILAVSITVPWMSQSICLPVYKAMDDLLGERDLEACTKRFAEYWVSTCLAVVPALILFALPFYFALHWNLTVLMAFLLLGFLNVMFGQLLVVANLPTDSRKAWGFSWLAYALALLIAPKIWFLPPLMGILVMLFVIRDYIGYLSLFKRLYYPVVAREMLRGFLIGTVLWADKYIFFISQGGELQVVTIYMGLIPAVVAYNYFFAAEAKQVDRAVAKLREAIQTRGYSQVQSYSKKVERRVLQATQRTLLMAGICSVFVAVFMFFYLPDSVILAFSIIMSSWMFLAVAIYSYQVDYLGSHLIPQVLGLAHLILCMLAFALIPNTNGYFIIMAGEVVLVTIAYIAFRKTWKLPAYDLFWRHAVTW